MAGIRCPSEEMELLQSHPAACSELISDDNWSVKSDCGSILDDEQRHMGGSDAPFSANSRPISDYYGSDKDERSNEVEKAMLGLQCDWDAIYTSQLLNFNEHCQVGEVWLDSEFTGNVVDWTKNLSIDISQRCSHNLAEDLGGELGKFLSSWNVLVIGTGNGLLPCELAKQGLSDITGIDYSEAAIDLAQNLAVDDVLETKLDRNFKLVMDNGALDAIGLHSDGPLKRNMYW